MALKCPNKNSKLYKKLSLQLSKRNVDNVFAKITTPEFDEWYGDKTRDKDGLPIINNYFEITNSKGERGSLLRETIKLESVEEVEKLLSARSTKGISLFNGRYYINKDTKQFGERMYKTLNYYFPGLLSRTSYFSPSEAIGVTDQSTPTTALQINNIFNSEGRIFYSPYKLEQRDDLVEESESEMQYLLNRLDEYSERIHDDIRNAQREAKKSKDYSKVERLRAKQEELVEAISELKVNNTVDNLSKIAKINLDYVERLFSDKENITVTELNEINDILGFYEYIDSKQKDKHPMAFLNDSDFEKVLVIRKDVDGNDIVEKDYLPSTKKVQEIAQTARNFRQDYDKLIKEAVTKYYNETYEGNKTIEDLFDNIKDITATTKLARDAASVGNSLLSLLHSINNDASRVANQQTLKDQRERELAFEEFKKSSLYKTLGKDAAMRLFWQVDESGKPTGGLINRYSTKYWKNRRRLFNKLFSNSVNDINEAKREYAATHEFVNYFETEEQREAERERLYQIFDKERVDGIIEEMDVEFAEFRDRRIDAFNEIDALDLDKSSKKYKKELWDLKNDPRVSINNIKNAKTETDSFGNLIKFNAQFVRAIPLKVNTAGEQTNFYDTNFEKIEKDKAAYDYYKYVKGTIKELLGYYPQSYLDSKKLHEGFIPVLKKDLLQQFMGDKMGLSLSKMQDVTRRWFSVKTYSKSYDHLDPSTGKVRDSLNIRMLSPNYKYVDGSKIIDTTDVVTDLNEILNQFIPVTNMYRHKSRLEATHNMVVNAIDQMNGVQKTPSGIDLITGKGEVATDDLNNLKELAKFSNDVFFEKAEKEVASKKKILTKDEKLTKDELEDRKKEIKIALEEGKDTLTEEQELKLSNELDSVDRKLSDLGYNLSSSKSIKSILKYFQLVSQGWNFSSATIELLYGFASNNMHASANREYNTKQISTAYRIAVAATMPGNNTKTVSKFEKLIEKFDVIGEVAEIENRKINNSKKSKFSARRALAPYELMRNADKVSKGSVMVAMLMNTNLEGKQLQEGEVSLWEALDENGNIKEEYATDEIKSAWEKIDSNKLLRLSTRIADVNKRNHGNYDPNSAILANSTALGKALLQFRRWMLEGFATRFENEKYHDNLNRIVKGRYQTYATMIGNLGDGNIVKGTRKTISVMFEALLHNFAFKNMTDDQLRARGIDGPEFSEADLENVRKNASGLKWLIVMYSMLLLAKMGLDDEDDKKNATMFNFLLNQGGRLQQDLTFYSNPTTMGDITKNIIPAIKLADRAGSWFTAASNTILDLDPEYSTEYERGDFKGSSKLLIKSGEMLPGTSTLIRTYRSASKLYD